MNIINGIKYFFLSLQENILQKMLKKTTQSTYSNSFGKQVLARGVSLKIDAKFQDKIAEVRTNVEAIVNKTECSVSGLLDYVKLAKTPVYLVNNADKLLNLILEEEGLIYEKKGFEALYLSIITGQGIKFRTEPMFILKNFEVDKFLLLHNFYRWYSLKSNLPGFSYEIQKNFKQFVLTGGSDEYIKHLSMKENLEFQEAIARDNEASEFVLSYIKKVEGAKNVLEKIKDDGSASV